MPKYACYTLKLSTEKSGTTLTVNPGFNAKLQMGTKKNPTLASLRSKPFCLVSGQTKTEERDFRFWQRERQKLKDGVPFFRAVFDSRSSFFAPKPHGNACYAGYSLAKNRANSIPPDQLTSLKITRVTMP